MDKREILQRRSRGLQREKQTPQAKEDYCRDGGVKYKIYIIKRAFTGVAWEEGGSKILMHSVACMLVFSEQPSRRLFLAKPKCENQEFIFIFIKITSRKT